MNYFYPFVFFHFFLHRSVYQRPRQVFIYLNMCIYLIFFLIREVFIYLNMYIYLIFFSHWTSIYSFIHVHLFHFSFLILPTSLPYFLAIKFFDEEFHHLLHEVRYIYTGLMHKTSFWDYLEQKIVRDAKGWWEWDDSVSPDNA